MATVNKESPETLARLDSLVDAIAAVRSKLILLFGRPGLGKSALLAALADRRGAKVLNVGIALGSHLVTLPQRQRALQSNVILKSLVDEHANGDLCLLDNIELLFDQTLRLDPLHLLERLAHSRRIVATWPGEIQGDRLVYAEMGHPEYKEYGMDGFVPFDIEVNE